MKSGSREKEEMNAYSVAENIIQRDSTLERYILVLLTEYLEGDLKHEENIFQRTTSTPYLEKVSSSFLIVRNY